MIQKTIEAFAFTAGLLFFIAFLAFLLTGVCLLDDSRLVDDCRNNTTGRAVYHLVRAFR